MTFTFSRNQKYPHFESLKEMQSIVSTILKGLSWKMVPSNVCRLGRDDECRLWNRLWLWMQSLNPDNDMFLRNQSGYSSDLVYKLNNTPWTFCVGDVPEACPKQRQPSAVALTAWSFFEVGRKWSCHHEAHVCTVTHVGRRLNRVCAYIDTSI